MLKHSIFGVLSLLGWVASISVAEAQWLTQSFDLKPGWNGIFLHVNPSHRSLDELAASNGVKEVWRWNPVSTVQIIEASEIQPVEGAVEWTRWAKGDATSVLQSLTANSAYLVKLESTEGYTWRIQGQVVAPRLDWSSVGLNLIGFSTPALNPPNWESFLRNFVDLPVQTTDIYHYVGGKLGSENPQQITPLRNSFVARGEAVWIRNGQVYNHSPGAFRVANALDGLEFETPGGIRNLRLENLSPDPLTVSLRGVDSEVAPSDAVPVVGFPPLLIRGAQDETNLTYAFKALTPGETYSWQLAGRGQVGSEVELVIGLDQTELSGVPGDLLAGVLRFTDSLGQLEVDIPTSAYVPSRAGLWVGSAAVTQVAQHLASYALDADGRNLLEPDGSYEMAGVVTNMAPVPEPFPLRLILHSPEQGNSVLLQRVFVGLDYETNYVVTTSESILNPRYLESARRLSSAHLPWSVANGGWAFNGLLAEGAIASVQVNTASGDQVSNPFLHTYHPDHDNKDALFERELPQGVESYGISRDITLSVESPADDFVSRTANSLSLRGTYRETIRIRGGSRQGGEVDERQVQVQGLFQLNQVVPIPSLTIP